MSLGSSASVQSAACASWTLTTNDVHWQRCESTKAMILAGEPRCVDENAPLAPASFAVSISLTGAVLSGGMRRRQGLAIDFDKDSAKKRSRNAERQRKQQRVKEELMTTHEYYCAVCGTDVLNLDQERTLSEMPRRSTDAAFAVHEKNFLRRLNVTRGAFLPSKREKEASFHIDVLRSIPFSFLCI